MAYDTWFTGGHLLGDDSQGGQSGEKLVELHNERVEPRDLVWILGNAAVNEAGLELLRQMNGSKVLLCGAREPWFHGVTGDIEDDRPGIAGKRWRRGASLVNEQGSLLIMTGATRAPIHIPLGFGIETVKLWSFPYWSHMLERFPDYHPRPHVAGGAVPRWLVYGGDGGAPAVDRERRLINVGVGRRGYTPCHIDDLRADIRANSPKGS